MTKRALARKSFPYGPLIIFRGSRIRGNPPFSPSSALAPRLQSLASRSQRRKKRDEKMKTISKAGLTIRSKIKAGGIGGMNHNRAGMKVRCPVKAGGIGGMNHNRAGMKVRCPVKAGGIGGMNHSRGGLRVSTAINAGFMPRTNHAALGLAI